VIDYPAEYLSLTKRKKDNPEIAERFECSFELGMELANGTRNERPDFAGGIVHDPNSRVSRKRDSMARWITISCGALRYGMAPAGRLRVGIDRLVIGAHQS